MNHIKIGVTKNTNIQTYMNSNKKKKKKKPLYEVQKITENNEKENTVQLENNKIAQDLTLDDTAITMYEKTKFGIKSEFRR